MSGELKKKMRETLQEAARKPVPPDEVQDLYSLSSVHPIFDLIHLFTKKSKINVDIDLKSQLTLGDLSISDVARLYARPYIVVCSKNCFHVCLDGGVAG